MNNLNKKINKAYVIAVDMGYGHQRAAFPLEDFATIPENWNTASFQNITKTKIISANNYPGIPTRDRIRWIILQRTYEFISRINGFPILGNKIFYLMDYFQKIQPFYPRRDLSASTFQLRQIYSMIKNGWGKNLIESLNRNPLPIVCTFPAIAFFAEEHGYKGEIYCLCTDTDIARSWAPIYPAKSRITYLASTARTKERLVLYGVHTEKIVVTGFPLPDLSLENKKALQEALARRLVKLDPKGIYQKKYKKLLTLLGPKYAEKVAAEEVSNPLTITFMIGGAGAQSDIGTKIIHSLKEHLRNRTIRLNLVAGKSLRIKRVFEKALRENKITPITEEKVGGAHIIYNENKFEYFRALNNILLYTDILWSKPSEISFYVGLGLPIIMTPALGSQEEYNKRWLYMMGAGFEQYDPKYANEWIFDWLTSGFLAEAAMSGFINAPKDATKHIKDLVLNKTKTEIEDVYFV